MLLCIIDIWKNYGVCTLCNFPQEEKSGLYLKQQSTCLPWNAGSFTNKVLKAADLLDPPVESTNNTWFGWECQMASLFLLQLRMNQLQLLDVFNCQRKQQGNTCYTCTCFFQGEHISVHHIANVWEKGLLQSIHSYTTFSKYRWDQFLYKCWKWGYRSVDKESDDIGNIENVDEIQELLSDPEYLDDVRQ